jgi:DNA-directed RNA polymerase specialized sigma24 family protein
MGNPETDTTGDLDTLIARMREGDRAAAAAFITRYGERVRRRVSGKLSPAMRRLFDSQEIMSTVARRLDHCVSGGELAAMAPDQLWGLIFRIAENSVVDKGRIYQRLRSVEARDSRFADGLRRRLESADARRVGGGGEVELDSLLRRLSEPLDREILTQWLRGLSHELIAQDLDLKPAMIRKRFERIKKHLRHEFGGDSDGSQRCGSACSQPV